jgi:hypothetical protein
MKHVVLLAVLAILAGRPVSAGERPTAKGLRLKLVAVSCAEFIGGWDEASQHGDWMDGEGMTVTCKLTGHSDARCTETWPQPGRVSTEYKGTYRVNANGTILVMVQEPKRTTSKATLGYLPSGKAGQFRTWNTTTAVGLSCIGGAEAEGALPE